MAGQAFQPGGAGFLVVVLDGPALHGDFVGAHGRVSDEDRLVVLRLGAELGEEGGVIRPWLGEGAQHLQQSLLSRAEFCRCRR